MNRIKNKMESTKLIAKLDLNRFCEEVFNSQDQEPIKKYLDNHKEKYYILRDKIKSSNKCYLMLEKHEIFEHINEYKLFSLDVCSINFRDNKLLLGDMIVNSNMDISISASSNKDSFARDFLEPRYFIKTDIFDRKLKYIPGLSLIIDYIFIHNLFDIVVEFAVFDKGVGIKNEQVIIFELRTDY